MKGEELSKMQQATGSSARRPAALLIVDQLGYDDFQALVGSRHGNATPVNLPYIPRTTPVGHATISTGQIPLVHGVHGRVWHLNVNGGLVGRDIDGLPDGVFDPQAYQRILGASLVTRIRQRHPDAAIVVTAAKGFIPFLLGGERADIYLYPPTTFPTYTGSDFRISVYLRWGTKKGEQALQRMTQSVATLWRTLVGRIAPGCVVAFRWTATEMELQWVLPPAANFGVGRYWRALIGAHASEIDEFYSSVATTLLADLHSDDWKVLIQSWFSTDTFGHFFGTSSAEYRDALDRAMAFALQLSNKNFAVAVTSDHGGTAMRRANRYDASSGLAAAPQGMSISIPGGAQRIVLSGDHLVGYSTSAPGQPHASFWNGTTSSPAVIPQHIAWQSFGGAHTPLWLLLPLETERFADSYRRGGDHGASVTANGTLSEVDGRVPWLTLGVWSPPQPPATLEQVARVFMSLH